ncbi:MAG: hypothetical protein AAFZ15_24485 [Bacteroidota bacterium]
MQKSKFITLLRTLERKEYSAFGKYVRQRHGTKSIVPSVFQYISSFYPNFKEDKKLEIAYAHQKIFKEPVGNNRTKLLNALSDLFLLLKEFLLLERVKKKSFENSALWTIILKERGLKSMSSNQAISLQKEVSAFQGHSVFDYMKGMIANYFFYYQFTHQKLSENISSLHECGEDLDLFYAVSRLKIGCEMANRKNLMSLDYNLRTLPAVVELSKSKELSNHPLLQLYLAIYELIANEKNQNFPKIENILVGYIDVIEPEELHAALSYLHNYASAQIRRGNENYWDMTHRLNKFSVEQELFGKSGEMSTSQFNNIIQAACKVEEFLWASSFKAAHQKLLEESVRDSATKLGEAIILFEQKNYRTTLEKLDKVKPTDLYHEIRSRSLKLISHFELENGAVDIVGFCIAFEGYLKRNRKPRREAVEATLRFVQIVKMLARQKAAKNAILEKIDASDSIYFKTWLLNKTAKYKK